MSLRKKVFNFIEQNNPTIKQCLKEFKEGSKVTVKRYFYAYKKLNESDITGDITLENLDTIKEMTLTVQLIKDPVKRAENLARLHNMKLKPIVNRDKKSLKEMFDQI